MSDKEKTSKTGPDPANPHPLPDHDRVSYLKNFIDTPLIEVGDYTYYDDPDGAKDFATKNVLYHYDFTGDKLIIGKFCALATNVTFIMNGANHAMGGFSTYPFNIFGGGWEEGFDPSSWAASYRGDTVVGHDVWIGRDVRIMPGVTIGNGAIIATSSVVTKDIPSFAIAGGNPAEVIKMRFNEATIETLQEVAWWDWDAGKISRNLDAIRGADLDALRRAT